MCYVSGIFFIFIYLLLGFFFSLFVLESVYVCEYVSSDQTELKINLKKQELSMKLVGNELQQNTTRCMYLFLDISKTYRLS